MSKFIAVLISFAVLATSFASTAEAFPGRRMGFFLGGMAAGALIGHAAEERRREEAYERARARQIMIAREQAAAAAARRERARLYALQQQQEAQQAAAAAQTPAPVATADNDADKSALKKGDRLPSEQDASAAPADGTHTTTIQKTSDTTAATTPATSETLATNATCRRYSAATDSLIDAPCN